MKQLANLTHTPRGHWVTKDHLQLVFCKGKIHHSHRIASQKTSSWSSIGKER